MASTSQQQPRKSLFAIREVSKKKDEPVFDDVLASILSLPSGSEEANGESSLKRSFDPEDSTYRKSKVRNAEGPGESRDARYISPSKLPSDASSEYDARLNAGKIEREYIPSDLSFDDEKKAQSFYEDGKDFSFDIQIAAYRSKMKKETRYFFDKLRDRSDAMEGRIESLTNYMIKKFQLSSSSEEGEDGDEDVISPIGIKSVNEVYIAGQICVDAVGSGKLNDKSVSLEPLHQYATSLSRINLDLSQLPSYTLFPGQIVVAKGSCLDGATFTPTSIYEGHAKPRKLPSVEQLSRLYFDSSSSSVQHDRRYVEMMMSVGPYTCASDASYQPLEDFLERVRGNKPHVVFMLGPFVDSENELVKNCELEVSFEQAQAQVLRTIDMAAKGCPGTKFVLVPSLSDKAHLRVYPQPPFDAQLVKSANIIMAANPSLIQVQEFTVGVSTPDVYQDFTKQGEIARGQQSDRVTRLAHHIMQQQCFYPVNPPEVNFDYTYFENTRLSFSPDVLITPSILQSFAKAVDGSLVINPGFLTRRDTGGSYARVFVNVPRKADVDNAMTAETQYFESNLPARTVVHIIKI